MAFKQFASLIEMLAFWAAHEPQKVAFTFNGQPVTYDQMWTDITRFGAYLQHLGIGPGDRVVLALPNSTEFFAAFYGVQIAGGISVPLFPGSGSERIFSIAQLCGSKIIVAPSTIAVQQLTEFKQTGAKHGLEIVTVFESLDYHSKIDPVNIQPGDTAFIQYTSGSTGNPKGVQLSHANLLTNVVQMIEGMQITAEEIFVSWLPIYHDMGLILKTMVPFFLGAEVHLLPTDLRDVRPWLTAIQANRATFTAAPDFAYRLCLRQIDPDDYDLTSLRVALNAAEPVRAQTIKDFEAAFGLHNVMVAGYGLAEATVGVSMWTPGSTPRVDQRGFVSVGHPFPNVKIKILDGDRTVPAREIGEIGILSQANSQGYFNNPEETARLFRQDGYLLSGDLGFLDEDGYLYIVSRKKNIIKLAGSTISPGEIEEVVDKHPDVRYCAAIGIDRGRLEGEQAYVFAEIREGHEKSDQELFDLTTGIVAAIHTRMGFRPGRVYLLKPKSIPLTYNGKIQHQRLKSQYLEGNLHKSGAVLYPEY